MQPRFIPVPVIVFLSVGMLSLKLQVCFFSSMEKKIKRNDFASADEEKTTLRIPIPQKMSVMKMQIISYILFLQIRQHLPKLIPKNLNPLHNTHLQ